MKKFEYSISRRAMMATATSALLTCTLLAGCGGAPAGGDAGSAGSAPAEATDTSAAATGTLIVGFDQAYPPYGFVGDDGEFTGFDLDLAQAVAEKQGWEVKLEPIDWDAKDSLLNSGAINCIWNGFTMEGREGNYTFSDPYMLNAQVVVVRADSGIASLDDLAGKTVVTQVDSAAEDVLEGDQADLTATFTSLETIAEYNTAFMQLESGAVDAVACDLSIAQYQMAANPDAYVMLEDFLSEENYAVGFKKGDTKTADAVTESLKALYEEGTVEELCEKYAEYGLSFENWVLK
ncbi:amino acid ABC transporter substrate-binding protein [Collinsella provencensis]|uniref:amino acid ABC transporter substrate-binding protein n=1 Tax=Collinsella provencensis TaxID=1937461 RepID=UPI0018FE6CDB|nr:amino acid ABC transporter substrate-binding protein [Collinsella provencensis]